MLTKALIPRDCQNWLRTNLEPHPKGTLKTETSFLAGGDTITEHFKSMPQLTLQLGFIKGKMKTIL